MRSLLLIAGSAVFVALGFAFSAWIAGLQDKIDAKQIRADES